MKEEMIKFDLKRLKGEKVVVNCRTKEQFQNFINWANSLRDSIFKDNNWKEYKEESCLHLGSDLIWNYASKGWFEKEGYEIISYEEALLKESNKESKETPEEPSKQTITQVVKQPKIKEEFISKVKTEKIGIRINSEEELSIWFNFLDKHSDKDLRRLKKTYKYNHIYANNSACDNIMGYNTDDGFYEKEGFKIYNFKDICEEPKPIKLSDFLKENDCFGKFINNFDKEYSYDDWKIEIKKSIISAFNWGTTEEEYDYWDSIESKWIELKHKENDLIDFFEDKRQDIESIKPLNYLVQVKGKGIAKVKHSYESAIKEAQRLCKKEAPTEVYVLEIKKTFKSEVIVKEI